MLQHNIRGLIGHQADLKLLINTLSSKNSAPDILLLCETFLTKHTVNMVNIPDTILFQTIERIAKAEVPPYY